MTFRILIVLFTRFYHLLQIQQMVYLNQLRYCVGEFLVKKKSLIGMRVINFCANMKMRGKYSLTSIIRLFAAFD